MLVWLSVAAGDSGKGGLLRLEVTCAMVHDSQVWEL